MASKYDHLVYILPDSGSSYERPEGDYLFLPGQPVPTASLPEDWAQRLIDRGVLARCTEDGKIKPGDEPKEPVTTAAPPPAPLSAPSAAVPAAAPSTAGSTGEEK